MSGIYSLCDEVAQYGNLDSAYIEKMIHPVPKTTVVNRAEYLMNVARDRVVLDLGASGPMAEQLQEVAREYYGADKSPNPAIEKFHQIDFEDASSLTRIPDLQLVIAGELIEHLSNPGKFLDLVHTLGVSVILTTPNAGGINQQRLIKMQAECVNKDHVAWYSYYTLKVLIERHHFKLVEWHWYNGQPLLAEGLIFKIEPNGTN